MKAEAPPRPEQVLQELFELLEEYAPGWYTEDHHRRARAALTNSPGVSFKTS